MPTEQKAVVATSQPWREYLPALAAWRAEMARGERTMETRDALWEAACWERSGEEVLLERPRCLSATYVETAHEREVRRQAQAKGIHLIRWLRASAEEASDLTAKERVEGWLERSAALIASDVRAAQAVERAKRSKTGGIAKARSRRSLAAATVTTPEACAGIARWLRNTTAARP